MSKISREAVEAGRQRREAEKRRLILESLKDAICPCCQARGTIHPHITQCTICKIRFKFDPFDPFPQMHQPAQR